MFKMFPIHNLAIFHSKCALSIQDEADTPLGLPQTILEEDFVTHFVGFVLKLMSGPIATFVPLIFQ